MARKASKATAAVTPPRRRWVPRGIRYPIWSAKNITGVALVAVALVTAGVLFVGHRPLLVELEITLGILAAALFLFLSVGLCHGVRIRKEQLGIGPETKSFRDIADYGDVSLPDLDGLDCDAGDGGCLGVLAAILAAVLLAGALILVLWVFVNIAWVVIPALCVAVFWVFNRALRQVFARSRQCKHRLGPSLAYAAFYTFLYTGWLFAMLSGVDYLKAKKAATGPASRVAAVDNRPRTADNVF